VSDSHAEWLYYYSLYALCGGIFALLVVAWKLSSPRYLGLVLICVLYSWFGFSVARATSGAHAWLESLRDLSHVQELIRLRILFHLDLVGSVLSSLSAVLAVEAL